MSALLLFPCLATAQARPASPPVRQLGATVATSTELLGSVAAVRQLPDGRVLVNDQARRRLILLDTTLKTVATVADSTSSTANAYGAQAGGLLAFRGDSSLFVDPASLSMLVIDPAGKIVRVMAAPRPQDVTFLTGGLFGNPGFDAQGRMIYRQFGTQMPARPAPGQPFVMPTPPDSAALVRFDLASRKLDTAGYFKVYRPSMTMTREENGGMRVTTKINPLPLIDDWAVLSDGTLAIVRGREYRVDLLSSDGTRRAGGKIPFDWQRLTDSMKVAYIDTMKAVMERARAVMVAGGPAPAGPQGATLGGGGQMVVISTETRSGGAGGAVQSMTVSKGAGDHMPVPTFVSPSELPDYKPVFGPGSVRADADGRLWVRTIATKRTNDGAIYDVIDNTGTLVDRVQVPANSVIAGFGRGGIVFLGLRDKGGLRLIKARS
ncbi:MAG: hypothetical protein H0W68_00245 [Gemmatimonadaceae bacterium]|nr:hypothetical protein [Gemmatimonadaceae bacterium]